MACPLKGRHSWTIIKKYRKENYNNYCSTLNALTRETFPLKDDNYEQSWKLVFSYYGYINDERHTCISTWCLDKSLT